MSEKNFWNEMRRMRKKMNKFFAYPDFPEQELGEPINYRRAWTEFSENEDSIFINIEIPGVRKEDIKVNLTDDAIEIKAEKKIEKKHEDEKRQVFSYAKSYTGFYRIIDLPERVDTKKLDKMEAEYKDGILRIAIPKKITDKSKKEIRIR